MAHSSGEDLHTRPAGVSDATLEAAAKVSEAFECIEEVRGKLYAAHRLVGVADLALGEAVELLRRAGHHELADTVDEEVVGRNVISGRWTFQVLEDFDDGYYGDFKRIDKLVRDTLLDGRRHVYEAEMKADRRTPGRAGHAATPAEGD